MSARKAEPVGKKPDAKPCPNCGHCPTCGNTPPPPPPQVVPMPYPVYPRPWGTGTPPWRQPVIYSGTVCSARGDSRRTVAMNAASN